MPIQAMQRVLAGRVTRRLMALILQGVQQAEHVGVHLTLRCNRMWNSGARCLATSLQIMPRPHSQG